MYLRFFFVHKPCSLNNNNSLTIPLKTISLLFQLHHSFELPRFLPGINLEMADVHLPAGKVFPFPTSLTSTAAIFHRLIITAVSTRCQR